MVARNSGRVELEIAGERVTVDGWPETEPTPVRPVTVDGESWEVRVTFDRADPERSAGALPLPRPPTEGAALTSVAEGVPVVPPMPGRVVEIRVHEGERVPQGAVLLVLEAMKMRTEIVSPVAGVVRGIRVGPGSNARAKEPMLFVDPS